jgi:hypothetical protein
LAQKPKEAGRKRAQKAPCINGAEGSIVTMENRRVGEKADDKARKGRKGSKVIMDNQTSTKRFMSKMPRRTP